jgi:exonuclease III
MNTGPVTLHVATLNVCGLPSSLAPLSRRADEFCRHIDESDIDVLNLQEVWGRRTLAAIHARLPSFPHVAWRRAIGGRPAGGLTTFSRRPLGTVSYRSFRGAVPDQGGVRFRAKRAVNSMLQGVLTVELAGLPAVVVNTHLTANKDGDWSADNRHHTFQRRQVEMLHAVLSRARTANTGLVIVTGDFNISSSCPLYPLIVGGGAWRDPFAATDPVTYHLDFLPPGSAPHRIDYLLFSGDEARYPLVDSGVLFAEPLALPSGRMYLSDHVALTARVGIPTGVE